MTEEQHPHHHVKRHQPLAWHVFLRTLTTGPMVYQISLPDMCLTWRCSVSFRHERQAEVVYNGRDGECAN